jgi:endonuclease-3
MRSKPKIEKAMDDQQQKIIEILIGRGEKLLATPRQIVNFTKDPEANRFLNDIENYPHGFVLGCIMDRQVPAEFAWTIPYRVCQYIGDFSFDGLKKISLSKLEKLVRHRAQYMAQYFHEAIQRIENVYGGDASRIWQGCPSSATIVRRFLEFSGVGLKIATMAANILVREHKIPVSDKFSIDISVDIHVRRVFKRLGLVRNEASDEEIIYTAKELNPEYPGIFDLAVWEIGRNWCHVRKKLDCMNCYMNDCCLKRGVN